jgi:hypothetical protein
LWPYPRAPFVEADSDIIELDFADTSALSDPDAFAKEQRSKNKRSQKKGRKEREKDREREREEIEKSWDVPPPVKAVPLPQPQGVVSTPAVPVNGKAKHARKERAGSVASQSSVDDTNAIDAHAVHASLLSALAQKKNANSNNFSRNDFVREVLTLIHVCFIFMKSRSSSLTFVFLDRQRFRGHSLAGVHFECEMMSWGWFWTSG